MEPIKIFLGILLIICILLCIDSKKIQAYLDRHKILHVQKTESPYQSVMGLDIRDYRGKVKITEVWDYTPAKQAGLEVGDRIIKINGQKVVSAKNLAEEIKNRRDQKPITLVVYRSDSCSTFPVELKPLDLTCQKAF